MQVVAEKNGQAGVGHRTLRRHHPQSSSSIQVLRPPGSVSLLRLSTRQGRFLNWLSAASRLARPPRQTVFCALSLEAGPIGPRIALVSRRYGRHHTYPRLHPLDLAKLAPFFLPLPAASRARPSRLSSSCRLPPRLSLSYLAQLSRLCPTVACLQGPRACRISISSLPNC